ncbi:MAG TPA: hypothetical protein VL985_04595 [Stellaceae bacterium]|nr:hypothetical protein [Stellaceae bacterium]
MTIQPKSIIGPTRIETGSDAAIAEFIRTRGVTRCPTACVLPTQGSVTECDRAALDEYASSRDRRRQARAARRNGFMPPFLPYPAAR